MPLFEIRNTRLSQVKSGNFGAEKELQALIQQNLQEVFNCRFVASEFSIGQTYGGRIDTLALSEENNPVIIEYKKVESSELINQSLFYLSWISDHKGDFEIAVQKALGNSAKVDWSEVRVICIAPNFRKYDLHAVQMMDAGIELWSYRLFDNSTLYMEEVFSKSYESTGLVMPEKSSSLQSLSAGKKAAITRATGSYTFEEHIEGKPDMIKELAVQLQDYVLGLDPAVAESPKKFYVAYKTSQNIVCMEVKHQKLILFVKLDPKGIGPLPAMARDVASVGHYGTGDLEITVKSEGDMEIAKGFIEKAYRKIGG